MIPSKYLSNFWRILEMHLINCETSLQLKWSSNYILFYILIAGTVANQINFQINDTKLYVFLVTSSTQEDTKLLKQFESGLKRTIS